MDDETKKELDRLWKLYYEKDKEFEAAKGKRIIITILGFTITFFLIFVYLEKPSGVEIIAALIGSLILSGFYVWINAIVFSWLCNKGREEGDLLESIKKRIDALNEK